MRDFKIGDRVIYKDKSAINNEKAFIINQSQET